MLHFVCHAYVHVLRYTVKTMETKQKKNEKDKNNNKSVAGIFYSFYFVLHCKWWYLFQDGIFHMSLP